MSVHPVPGDAGGVKDRAVGAVQGGGKRNAREKERFSMPCVWCDCKALGLS